VTENADGTKTIVSYKKNADGKTVRITQKIKLVTAKEKVNPSVAERKAWAKFGLEKGAAAGPSTNTTSPGEAIPFKLGPKEIKTEQKEAVKETVGGKSFKCRICQGDHFTAKCPMRDYLSSPDSPAAPAAAATPAAAAAGDSGYIPPHLRGKGGAAAVSLGAKGDRDDSATLRVSNLNEDAIEEDLQEMFGLYGPIVRCNIVRDRDTGKSRGFGFVSFTSPDNAEMARKALDKTGFDNLIINVEFSGKRER
jgi:translation initiation factor 3 subunit G